MYSDEDFLRSNYIEYTKQIKLFVRVKERIRPRRCTCVVTPICIEITLIEDNPYGSKWNQLEPNEFLENRPSVPSLSSVPSHSLGSTKLTPTDNIHRG